VLQGSEVKVGPRSIQVLMVELPAAPA
jgi:hypothetical protein